MPDHLANALDLAQRARLTRDEGERAVAGPRRKAPRDGDRGGGAVRNGDAEAASGGIDQARGEAHVGLRSTSMDEQAQKIFDALRELVEQVESSNARDDHGHPLQNLHALRVARALIDEFEGANASS
jgi:hypothetical protein